MAGGGDKYRFEYAAGTPYSHAVGLIERVRAPSGEVVVDLGCGFGAIAEPVRDLGLGYLGVDLEESGLRSLEARGFEALASDVCAPIELLDALTAALAGRRVAAITALDCLEHLPNATEVLSALSSWAASSGGEASGGGAASGAGVPLVVSIPNVSHRDLGAKLLIGRWDVTPTGLLDATHVRFFAPSTLVTTMAETGWAELGTDDFEREESDQHFPTDCPVLLSTTPVGAWLRRVRGGAAPGGAITNQFVRAYSPREEATGGVAAGGVAAGGRVEGWLSEVDDVGSLFLSVIVLVPDTGASLAALDTLLGSLCAQSATDFEVVVVVDGAAREGNDGTAGGAVTSTPAELASALTRRHGGLGGRLRAVGFDTTADGQGAGAGSEAGTGTSQLDCGVLAARGRYVALLCPRDVAEPNWVAELALTAAPGPGRVLDAGPARGAHLLAVLASDPGPLCAFAFPRSVFVDLGVGSGDHGASSDWILVARAVELCGLSPTPSRALVHRHGDGAGAGTVAGAGTGDDSGAGASRGLERAEILAALDRDPLLLDRGAATLLVALHDERDGLLDVRDQLRAELAAVHGSTSWRVTSPLRAITGWRRRR